VGERGTTSFLIAGWYVALLVPTLIFKYVYLAAVAGNISTQLTLLANSGTHVPLWWVHVHDIVPADFLDVLWLLAGLWLVGRVLLRIPVVTLACVSVLMTVLVGGGHMIAVREIGAPLTLDNVRITRAWIAEHPGLIGQFLTPRRLVWLLTGLAWAATPVLFANCCQRLHARQWRTPHAVWVAMVLVLSYSLVFGASAAFGSSHAVLRRGFWTSIVSSALAADATDPVHAPIRSQSDLLDAYDQIAFPHGRAAPSYVADIPPSRRIRRHVVIVTLETAPQEYYPLADSPDLPAFHAMSAHAMVSTDHYASAPITNLAIYSLITGTYPPPGSPIIQYRFKTDGLADVLSEHGYDTSFIESYDLQWNGPDDERLLRDLGFPTIRDALQLAGRRQAEWDAYRIALETRAFDAAVEQVAGAARRDRKAFVFVETNLGHFNWLHPPDQAGASAADRIAYTVRTLDTIMGRFLNGLANHGLADDVLIVVVGDHGLRFKTEFDSVSEPVTYADLVFNVPFLAYCPGLFPQQVRLPFPTSHIDIAPTVLDLLGIPRDGRLYLGRNMLDRRLADRIVFLPSASFTGLYPVDGFRWKDRVYSLHRIIDRVTVRDARGSASTRAGNRSDVPISDDNVRRTVLGARSVFEDTAAYFRRQFRPAPGASAARE
jgi:hypothetical protein